MSNRRKKILFVLGTRPEAIKMASVIEKFKKKKKFNIRLCVTAQHREMLDQVLNIFRLKADYDLNVMSQNQDLFDITGKILSKLKTVINDYRPDYIFVHGDTTTAMVGALAGFYTNTLVCHVEAGLRTYDLQSPYPEEFNRQLVGKLSKFHFTPTIKSKNNLLNELIDKKKILVSGNTVIDSLLIALEKIDKSKKISKEIFSYFDEIFSFNLKKEKFILITGHRRENFGEDFKKIFTSLKRLAKKNADVRFIYPVHLNPNVRFQVYDILGNLKNFHLIDPLPYLHFITLMKYNPELLLVKEVETSS